jgi:glutathione S-transferase|tara:strand:- start:128 stop:748 length:621 start_codon:yes stop_codon:yes gene_type:complete
MELTYFDFGLGGRAFSIRCALNHAGVDFKDNRLKFPDFQKLKAEGQFPTGVPVLKMADGRTFVQSLAILRYAGKLAGLYPEKPVDALACDMICDTANELMANAPQDSDQEKKKKGREEYAAGKMKAYMNILSKAVEAGGGKYACGNDFSIADLAILFVTSSIMGGNFDYIPASYMDDYPLLKELDGIVKSHEVVTNWLAKVEASKL